MAVRMGICAVDEFNPTKELLLRYVEQKCSDSLKLKRLWSFTEVVAIQYVIFQASLKLKFRTYLFSKFILLIGKTQVKILPKILDTIL